MKRNFTYKSLIGTLLVLAIIIVVQSCHRVDPDPDSQRAIGFSVLETKTGATADNIGANGSAFIVRGSVCSGNIWSSSGASAVFDGVTVTSNGSVWTYSPLRYWYPSSAYRFRAVWPASTFSTSAATYTDGLDGSASITGFTVSSDANVDLLLSNLAAITTDDTGTPTSTSLEGGKVKLTFGHLLSKINVSVAQQDAEAGLYITNVTISGMKGSGSFTGTSDTGTWTTSGSTENHSKSFSTAQALDGTNFYTIWNEGLFLIPQSLSDIKLSVTFQEGTSGTSQTLSANLGTSSWLQGKSYEYKATLTVKQIEFTVKVVDWVDGGTETLHK